MAQGLPDWHSRSLPSYGSAVRNTDLKSIPDGIETELFLLEKRGIVYDGLITTGAANDPGNFLYILKVDGNLIMDRSPVVLLAYNIIGVNKFPMSLCVYDTVNNHYYTVINTVITFEISFGLYIYQVTGVNVPVWWDYRYALAL